VYGISELKPAIVSNEQIECPVLGCKTKVPRRRQGDPPLCSSQFFCGKHQIYISPTTFLYASEVDNLLWKDEYALKLWENIKTVKRESRIASDNSEDALSWNVFRYLELSDTLGMYLKSVTREAQVNCVPVYWSYDNEGGSTWPPLYSAREEFGEVQAQSSEPDIIVYTDSTVFFIEAKFGASNTTPDKNDVENKIGNPKDYLTGGDGWYSTVFRHSYATVVRDQKYELLRFWLLGSWIARQMNKNFVLINLVRAESERDIETDFGMHIQQGPTNRFLRSTWEDIYLLIQSQKSAHRSEDKILTYLKNKTLGYKSTQSNQAKIIKAFSI
jgi:hypothetical protein